MSQDDILTALGDRRLTRREIQELTDLAQRAVSYSLKQLLKYDEIIKEMSEKGVPMYKVKKKKGKVLCKHKFY